MWQSSCNFMMEAVNSQDFQTVQINLITLNLFNLSPSICQSFEIMYKNSGCIITVESTKYLLWESIYLEKLAFWKLFPTFCKTT